MNKQPIIYLNEKAILPLHIVSLLLAIFSILTALFSGSSYAFVVLTHFLSIPSIVLSILLIVQHSKPVTLVFSIITLICDKVAWLIMSFFLLMEIVNVIKKYTLLFFTN